jgi:hypothetical protein
MTNVYRITGDGKKELVGSIHGGFVGMLASLIPVLGPVIGELLGGLTNKIFGKGKYMMDYQGEGVEIMPHELKGAGILEFLGSLFSGKGVTGGSTWGGSRLMGSEQGSGVWGTQGSGVWGTQGSGVWGTSALEAPTVNSSAIEGGKKKRAPRKTAGSLTTPEGEGKKRAPRKKKCVVESDTSDSSSKKKKKVVGSGKRIGMEPIELLRIQ